MTRSIAVLYEVASEIKEKVDVSGIFFDKERESRSFLKKEKNQTQLITKPKFNGRMKLSSFLTKVKEYEDKYEKRASKINSRVPLGLISQSNSSHKEEEKRLKRPKRICTKEKETFYDEMLNKVVKLKKFKEDEVSFTSSEICPEIQWQKLDNDVKTDEEQIKNGQEMLLGWIGDTIKMIKKDEKYLNANVSHGFKLKYAKKF